MDTFTTKLDEVLSAPLNLVERMLPGTLDYDPRKNDRRSMLNRDPKDTQQGMGRKTASGQNTMLAKQQPQQKPQAPAATPQQEIVKAIKQADPKYQKGLVKYAIQQILGHASKAAGRTWRVRAGFEPRRLEEDATVDPRRVIDSAANTLVKGIYGQRLDNKKTAALLKQAIVDIRGAERFDFETDQWREKNLAPKVLDLVKQAIQNGKQDFKVLQPSRNQARNKQTLAAYKQAFDQLNLLASFSKMPDGNIHAQFGTGLEFSKRLLKLAQLAKNSPKFDGVIELDYKTEDLLDFIRNNDQVSSDQIAKVIKAVIKMTGLDADKVKVERSDSTPIPMQPLTATRSYAG